MNKDLQVENGNFTRIVNPLIEELITVPFKGCELAVALFIIRKTYGFQKKQDEISLTQFEIGLKRTRPSIVKALKNLQLVNIVKLVKRGDSKNCSNIWEINKYATTWELVSGVKLVKRKQSTSKAEAPQLVKPVIHTKETKENTKESKIIPPSFEMVKHYCDERNNGIDPQYFIDRNTTTGWLMKNGAKMKDWQGAIRTWETNQKRWNADKPIENPLEKVARELLAKYGEETACWKFLNNHTTDELLKVKHIISL
jgi:phage replication O-like protein O